MAKRELGYVELVWVCPTCDTRNPGSRSTCSNCGAPQPANIQFQLPDQITVLDDATAEARVEAGPDIQCGYCGARNAASATVCHQCGADLTAGMARDAGQIIGAPGEQTIGDITCPACGTVNPGSNPRCSSCGTPLPGAGDRPPRPLAQPISGGSKAGLWIFAGIAVVVLLAAIVFLVRGARTSDVTATVVDTQWVRRVDIAAPVPVQREAWRDQIPYGVPVGACTRDVRRYSSVPVAGAVEVCGTPYVVDTGTGIGRMVQDCDYAVYDQRCVYTEMAWTVISTAVERGHGFSPAWPDVALTGEQRIADRNEQFQCVLQGDGAQYTFSPDTLEEYQLCREGQTFVLQVNGFGDVVAATPR